MCPYELIEMERMYQKCKGNPHMKEVGWAVPEAIRQTCKDFRSLKVRWDGFVGLGPLFHSVKKLASFYEYMEVGSGVILPNIVSPFRVWHKLWSAGILVSEARLSAMGKEASGLVIAPTLSRIPIPWTRGGGSWRGKSVASVSMVASCNRAIINDPGTGPTGKRKATAALVLGVRPSVAPPSPGPVVLWKQNSLAFPTPGSGRNTPKPIPVSTSATAPRSVASQTLPEVGAGGVVRSLFHLGESGPHCKMARKMMLKHVLKAARTARESAEKSLEAIETHTYLELGTLEAQAHMSQVAAGGLEDESILPEGG
jgi:hypothetical protein